MSEIIFRVGILLVVAFLGCIAYYSRKVTEPLPLLKLAGVRALVLGLWTVAAFAIMRLVEWVWIDG